MWYRHDFGLLGAVEAAQVRTEARMWLRAWQKEIAGIRAAPQSLSMQAALEPFAKYEMVAIGFNGCFSKEDLKECTWVAGFKGPQPEFRHFQNAREALAVTRPEHRAPSASSPAEAAPFQRPRE
jgi:hypothetical protein